MLNSFFFSKTIFFLIGFEVDNLHIIVITGSMRKGNELELEKMRNKRQFKERELATILRVACW